MKSSLRRLSRLAYRGASNLVAAAGGVAEDAAGSYLRGGDEWENFSASQSLAWNFGLGAVGQLAGKGYHSLHDRFRMDRGTREFMKAHGLTRYTRVHRAATGLGYDAARASVKGNPRSSAKVWDHGRLVPNPLREGNPFAPAMAQPEVLGTSLGAGLNVFVASDNPYAGAGRINFSFQLGEILDRGGKIYQDSRSLASMPGRVLYATFRGAIPVRLEARP